MEQRHGRKSREALSAKTDLFFQAVRKQEGVEKNHPAMLQVMSCLPSFTFLIHFEEQVKKVFFCEMSLGKWCVLMLALSQVDGYGHIHFLSHLSPELFSRFKG